MALFYAVHPLHVESVAWISERKDVLSTFWLLCTLLAYEWYARQPGYGRLLATGLASDRFNILSAGTDPKDHVHPLAVQVMAEDGVDISSEQPKHLRKFLGHISVRYLLIVCSDADETCPRIWPGMLNRIFWNIDDPASFHGSHEEQLQEFRRVRDDIKSRIARWLLEAE